MRDWVANDLAGPGSVRRFMIRMAIPPIFVLAPFWLSRSNTTPCMCTRP
jgi:hypothetical protein